MSALVHEIDRTGWPAGPWDGEPDRVDFEAHGFPCFLLRTPHGAWCGYVGVPNGHPLHGVDYWELGDDAGVHGGITYSNKCRPPICHAPKSGEPDDVWWFGFDASHCGDKTPGHCAALAMVGFGSTGIYRTAEYMRANCERLASQLAEVAR